VCGDEAQLHRELQSRSRCSPEATSAAELRAALETIEALLALPRAPAAAGAGKVAGYSYRETARSSAAPTRSTASSPGRAKRSGGGGGQLRRLRALDLEGMAYLYYDGQVAGATDGELVVLIRDD